MASTGLGPSFGQRDWACGQHCKVEAQGLNGPGDPMSYINYISKKKKRTI